VSGLVPHQHTVPAAERPRNVRPALTFRDLTKLYHPRRPSAVRALDGFSLQVERGEIMGFLGPNGAGKTTAMHLALGLLRPTRGSGELLGSPFGDARARRRVGFVPEYVGVPNRDARHVVRWAAKLNGIPDDIAEARTEELLHRLELQSVAARNVKGFSRGMLQRVGIAQALVNDPELLILDEPTSALDPAGRVLVRDLLMQCKEQGKTVFLSSHLLSEIEEVCDRVAIVVAGRVVCLGSMQDLLRDETQFEIVAEVNGKHTTRVVTAAEQRAVIEGVWATGGSVLRVHPVRRSLEDLFLEVTKAPS
jgi:ABC-2 type transport system ATP-binding protein